MSPDHYHVIKMSGTREDIALIITAVNLANMGPGSVQAGTDCYEYRIVGTGGEMSRFFSQLDALKSAYLAGVKAIVHPEEPKPNATP
jgi:hypothetical protein